MRIWGSQCAVKSCAHMFYNIYAKKAGTLWIVPSAEQGTIFALDQRVKEYTPRVDGAGGVEAGGSGCVYLSVIVGINLRSRPLSQKSALVY